MLLQELNAFSLRITQAIEIGDWQQLSNVLAERQSRLEVLLNSSLSDEDQRTVQGVLESVQAMDRLFIEAVQSKKTELLKQFLSVAQGQKVIRAYRHYAEF